MVTPKQPVLSVGSRGMIFLVKGYQYLISPLLGNNCRYYPSCSSYTVEAIQLHGALKGGAMGVWRIVRCNPFSKGGYEPVPGSCDHIEHQQHSKDH